MDNYEAYVQDELATWQRQMRKSPNVINRLSKNLQVRVNRAIPEKVHQVFTTAIKHMVRTVLAGAGLITPKPQPVDDLQVREEQVREKIKVYRNTATAEGAVTGAGGLLLGLADFPLWLTLKFKMLFDIAALYGHDVNDYRERVYILHIFQLAFSSREHRQKIFAAMEHWPQYQATLPADMNAFDWRTFQQEYRDYIDLAKLLQLIPGIGAVVGGYVNHRLTEKLGRYAMQSYRMRHQKLLMEGDTKRLQ